jgi:hypothetical protein
LVSGTEAKFGLTGANYLTTNTATNGGTSLFINA